MGTQRSLEPMERDEVYSITTAKTAKRDDVLSREIRYGISMGIRTICFVMAVVAWRVWDIVWLGAVFLVGAVVLPYTSVILANAGVRRRATGKNLLGDPELPAGEDSAAD